MEDSELFNKKEMAEREIEDKNFGKNAVKMWKIFRKNDKVQSMHIHIWTQNTSAFAATNAYVYRIFYYVIYISLRPLCHIFARIANVG